jgi:LPXTG-site transpeptidase (sortase) family protein
VSVIPTVSYYLHRIERWSFVASAFVLNGVIVVAFTAIAGVGPFQPRIYTPTYSFARPVPPDERFVSGTPTKIVVPSLQISLPIGEGFYNREADNWTLDYQQAFYAVMTAEPNSAVGNTLIYAHNVPELFGSLHGVEMGALAYVHTAEGHTFVYRYSKRADVLPRDVGVVRSRPDKPTLTLQTCGGTWNEHRTLFEFTLKEVQKHDA